MPEKKQTKGWKATFCDWHSTRCPLCYGHLLHTLLLLFLADFLLAPVLVLHYQMCNSRFLCGDPEGHWCFSQIYLQSNCFWQAPGLVGSVCKQTDVCSMPLVFQPPEIRHPGSDADFGKHPRWQQDDCHGNVCRPGAGGCDGENGGWATPGGWECTPVGHCWEQHSKMLPQLLKSALTTSRIQGKTCFSTGESFCISWIFFQYLKNIKNEN